MELLAQKLKNCYGEALAAQIERAFFCERPVTLRVNPFKTDVSSVLARMEEAGIACERVGWYADALVLPDVREDAVRALPMYERGEIYLQSLSSMLPPLYLHCREGESLLDMAAAPGGKTTQLSALSGGRVLITACERDRIRAERLAFNIRRQGAPRITVMNVDALKLDEFFRFDHILLDAPCSGSGTVSPRKRTNFSEKLLAGCVRTQEALVKKALRLLKQGGTLLYSTCSVLKEENEELLERALKGSKASLSHLSPPEGVPLLPSREGTVCVRPDELYEGFFLAKIVKE